MRTNVTIGVAGHSLAKINQPGPRIVGKQAGEQDGPSILGPDGKQLHDPANKPKPDNKPSPGGKPGKTGKSSKSRAA